MSKAIHEGISNKLDNFIIRSIPILLAIFVFLNPIPHTTAIKEICFYLSTFFTVLLIARKKIEFQVSNPLTLPFCFLLAWAMLDAFFALNKPNTIHDIYAHLIKYIIFFFLIVNFFNTRDRLNNLLWVMMGSANIFVLWAAFHFYFALNNPITVKFGLKAFTELPSNLIAIITIPAVIFSLHFTSRQEGLLYRLIFVLSFFFAFTATILTQARSAFASLLISFALLYPKNKKAMLALVPILLIIFVLAPIKSILSPKAIFEKLKGDDRINIIYTFIEMAKDYPLTGIGFGMQTYYDEKLLSKYNERVPAKYKQPVPHKAPHNIVVDIFVRLGVVGLGLYLYIFFIFSKMSFSLVRYNDDKINSLALCTFSAFIGFFIIGMFENVSSGVPAIIMYLLFAIAAILWNLRMTQEGFKQAHGK